MIPANPAQPSGGPRRGGMIAGAIIGLLTAIPAVIAPYIMDVTAQIMLGFLFLLWLFLVFVIPGLIWFGILAAALCRRRWRYFISLVMPAMTFLGVVTATIAAGRLVFALF
jgi:hypothetical protein